MSRPKIYIFAVILCLVSLLAVACTGETGGEQTSSEPSGTSSAAPEANFRFLISDDANAIEKFASVNVTISEIGVQSKGESGNWTIITPDITVVPLKPLTEENALEIWSGNITPGDYHKVFIYVTDIIGVLNEEYGGGTPEIMLPSDKLHITKPFTVSENSTTSFVYDITVVEAGKSNKYILQPQITQSGAGQKFREVEMNQHGKSDLENVFWTLIAYGSSDNLTNVIEDTEVTIRFEKGTGDFSGSAGCNQYGGSYEVNSDNLSVESIYSTEKYCEAEGVMDQEQAYLAILTEAEKYAIDNDCLTIFCGDNVLNFRED
jgi:heat shock protein HslJ